MHVFTVSGKLGAVYVALVITAANVAEAIAKAQADEPELVVTNVTRNPEA